MKVVVLLSGGLDSSTLLAKAIEAAGVDNVKALSISYGQKHSRELRSAMAIAKYYGVQLNEETINPFQFSDCSLLVGREDIEHCSYAEQQKESVGPVSTYVPFRNGLMLSIAAAYAYSIGYDTVAYAAHADDAAGNAYPDCTPEFVQFMDAAIWSGTGSRVTVWAPFIAMNKAGIVAEGLRLNVPYELTWSCYEGGEVPCGECGTCIDRQKAFEANNAVDPFWEVD